MNVPDWKMSRLMVAGCCIFPAIPLPAVDLDPDSRWEIRDFYKTVYTWGTDSGMEWDGDYASGEPGTVSETWQEATRIRLDYFRSMAGISGELVLDEELSAMCREAALMMSANNALSHSPPENWLWWSGDGSEAARNSNLALGTTGAESVEGYMADFGASNYRVGHRRWILNPPSTVMGNGDVPGDPSSGLRSANALWVVPGPADPGAETRDPYVAWPPRGYVPVDFAYARWSFSHPGADFSAASVTLHSDGQQIPVRIEPGGTGNSGDSAIVWVAHDLGTASREPWPFKGQDQAVEVRITGVRINGTLREFSYTVVLFDPRQPGPEEYPHHTLVPDEVYVDVPTPVQGALRPWAEALQARLLEARDYYLVHNAERGENTLLADISPGYSPVQTNRKATGSWAFHLANPDSTSQSLTIPGEFIVGTGSPSLRFDSSLAWASAGQYASVDVNSGSGSDWESVWMQSGPAESGNALTEVRIDLTPWAGRTIRLRFRYDHQPGTSYYPQVEDSVGWAFDNILLSGVREIIETTLLPVSPGSGPIGITFNDTQPVSLQTRSLAFGDFPLEWGPVVEVQPQVRTGAQIPPEDWVLDPMLGWVHGSGNGWAYSPVMGHIDLNHFPWIHTAIGWLRLERGSMESGLWLYHPVEGFLFTREDLEGAYLRSPFTSADRGSFRR